MGKDSRTKAEGVYGKPYPADVTETEEAKVAADNGENDKKKPFSINIIRHEDFNGILETKFITSNDFCSKIAQLLRSVFADFEACDLKTYRDTNTGIFVPQIHLYFNHTEPNDDTRPNAITRDSGEGDRKTSNATIKRVRTVERMYRNGDRYFLTDEGKDALTDFFYDNVTVGRKGKIDFGKYVTESSIPSAYLNNPPIPVTHVAPLDPAKFATKIYGPTDDNGKNLIYAFQVGGSIPTMFGAPSNGARMACTIMRVSEDNVAELSNQLGINYMGGSTLVRG